MLLGIAPLRLSFAGGGTDLKEYYEDFEGSVVSTAINCFTYVIVTGRQDNSFQLFSSDFQAHFKPTQFNDLKPERGSELAVTVVKTLDYQDGANLMLNSEVAPGSGLGASSSLAVNLIKTISTLKHEKMSNEEIAESAYDIGRNKLNWFIGKQDEYISAFGGFNFIKFKKDKVTVNKISINRNSLLELQKNLVVFYIGPGKNRAAILENQIKQVFKNLKAVCKAANASLDDIVKLNVYLQDLSVFSTVNKIMEEFFKEPYPARAAIEVAKLPLDALIEVEGIIIREETYTY